MEADYDVVIVGASIAGLTAAPYTSSLKLKTLIIGRHLCDQLNTTTSIESYPTISKTLELAKQVEIFGIKIVFDEVKNIEKNGDVFIVKTEGGGEYKTLAVILAFDRIPKELGVPGEVKFKNRGVSYCTICNVLFSRVQDVALVSWGDLARVPAAILSSISNKFYWIYPSDKPIHDEEFIEQVKKAGKAIFVPNSEVVEIKGDYKVKSVVVRNVKTSETQELPVSTVFIEVGFVVKSDFVKHLVDLNERGEIVADWEGKTKTPGVFAAGGIVAYPYKQSAISVAMGAAAAFSAFVYVTKMKNSFLSSAEKKQLTP